MSCSSLSGDDVTRNNSDVESVTIITPAVVLLVAIINIEVPASYDNSEILS